MKKVLGFLLLSSSLLPMQLAYKLQTPHNRFNRVTSALIKANKPQDPCTISTSESIVSHEIDAKEVRINPSSVHVPHNLSGVELYHGKKGFVVLHDDKKHVIEKPLMDPIARSITQEQLKSFLTKGYFAINQTNDGCFTLKAHHRLVGGGPLFGKIMYWTTKVTCYGVLAATAGAIVVLGGASAKGVAAKSTPSGANVGDVFDTVAVQGPEGYAILNYGIEATVTQASGEAIFSPAVVNGSMAAAGIVGAGIIKAGYAAEAANVTGAALATGTSGGGIVAGIEAISLAVGIFCGFTPTP